jgi:hypothetical protein
MCINYNFLTNEFPRWIHFTGGVKELNVEVRTKWEREGPGPVCLCVVSLKLSLNQGSG